MADHARETGLGELKERADEQVKRLQAASEERAAELHKRAEADIAGIGEWETTEAERIRTEAAARVAARRGQLDQQIAAETRGAEQEREAVEARVAEYERELEAYYVQLSEFSDPAAFAAAAKRMPSPPSLGPGPAAASPTTAQPGAPPAAEKAAAEPPAAAAAAGKPATEPPAAEPPATDPPAGPAGIGSNGATATQATAPATPPDATPAQTQAGVAGADTGGDAAPAAQKDAVADTGRASEAPSEGQEELETPPATTDPAPAEPGESRTTSVIVKGLASFGAITGFRQSMAALEGVEGVQLSLGPTGEFVYRATHPDGFDIASAIGTLEAGNAQVAREEDGTLRVTISRAR